MKGLEAKKGIFVIEKRRDPRYKVELPIDYSPINEKENYRGTIANANEGGILVYLPDRLEIGGLFRIKIFFPMDTVLSTIQAIAKVVWVDSAIQKPAGEYRYGLQLQSFLKGDLNKFRKLLKEVGHAHN